MAQVAALGSLALLSGCLTSSGPLGAAVNGTIRVNVNTSGVNQDPDGYLVNVRGVRVTPVATNDVVEFPDLVQGPYTVILQGVAINCVVDGGDERTVNVPAGNTIEVDLRVECFGQGGR